MVAVAVPAQIQHHAMVRSEDESLSVTITTAGADIVALFDTMRRGLTTQVEYRIRISVPRARPFTFLGDRLLREYRLSREARWDPYILAYVMTDAEGREVIHTEEATLYTDLFTVIDFRVPWEEMRRERGLVVEVSAEYTPIVFVPGLNILSLFTPNRRERSPWSRHLVDSMETEQ